MDKRFVYPLTPKAIMDKEDLHRKANSQWGRKPGMGEGKSIYSSQRVVKSSTKLG